jgi:predicted Zn-dependent protease
MPSRPYNLDKLPDDLDHVACHEMGHTVALRHGSTDDGCMAKNWRHWSAHSRAHVDGRY